MRCQKRRRARRRDFGVASAGSCRAGWCGGTPHAIAATPTPGTDASESALRKVGADVAATIISSYPSPTY